MANYAAAVALVLLLLPTSALAFDIQAKRPDEVAQLQGYEAIIPYCPRAVIETYCHHVKVVKHGILGTMMIDGTLYIKEADTFFRYHETFIDVNTIGSPVVYLHEMGHWYDQEVITPEYGYAWSRAVSLDFSAMDASAQDDNAYFEDPHEAAAELFAYAILGKDRYLKSKYHARADLFVRANAMMAEIIAHCGSPASK